MLVNLTLPYPPVLNTYYRMVMVKGSPRMLISAAGRAYKTECGWIAKSQGARIQEGELAVWLHAFRPRRVGDADGIVKALFDSLNSVCWNDDAQIRFFQVIRDDDKTNPRIEIEVRPYEPASCTFCTCGDR